MKKVIKLKTAIIVWIAVFILSIGTTFAVIYWSSGNTFLAGSTMCFDIESNNDPSSTNKPTEINFTDMTASLTFDESSSASTILTFQRTNTTECNSLYGLGTITANVTTSSSVDLSTGGLKYKIIDTTNSKEVANGSILTTGENILYDNFYINEYVSYTVYFWLDANYINNSYLEASFSGTLTSSARSTPTYENYDNLDESGANAPKLVEGMIPIYYDETDGEWHKADRDNNIEEYKWYDYTNKQWANVVLVDSDSRETYMEASRGTTINMDDILAFYVWIPRYKYRVWSINRQVCGSTDTATCEEKYAYSAFSTGIDIEFETGTATTGNVSCTYNPYNDADPTTLSDTCIYNGTDTITTSTDNTKYTDAWYTHPAFTFGSEELTGFWVGKFETTGTSNLPTILPNYTALNNQNVATQFTTSQLFGASATYGITDSNLDAHMLKNTEWGAVAYLSHSNYGLCNETSCIGMYTNDAWSDLNKSTTGRSGGRISDGTYSDYGSYTYDGRIVNSDGSIGDYAEDKTLGTYASTTGNIYGIYDMNGGLYENVMADMYSIPTGTYVGPIGTSNSGFNGVDNTGTTIYTTGNSLFATVTSTSLVINKDNLKYYDSYSYATGSYWQNSRSYNRSILGDAISEIVSITDETSSAWKPGSGVNGAYSWPMHNSANWLRRGGRYSHSYASIFSFYAHSGGEDAVYTFRSSLS